MKYILIFFLLTALIACTSSKRVTITGICSNSHKGIYMARIVTDSSAYYLKRLKAWDKEDVGKNVTVTGRLKIIIDTPPDHGYQHIARMPLFVRHRYTFE